MGAIFKREINAYFTSAIGYIYYAVFLFALGLLFYLCNILSATPDMSSLYSYMVFLMVVFIPILTMRLFSEDKRQKTDQALLTAPVSLTGIVLGKFFAALLVYSAGVLVTLIMAVILATLGTVEAGVIIGSVFGLILLGGALIAVGMFISSLTESQMVAAIVSVIIILFLLIADSLTANLAGTVFAPLASLITISTRFSDFANGNLNISDIIYFISVAAVFIFLTTRIVEKKRWS